jgi:hypothetical protein
MRSVAHHTPTALACLVFAACALFLAVAPYPAAAASNGPPEQAAQALLQAMTAPPHETDAARNAFRATNRAIQTAPANRRAFIDANGIEYLVAVMRMHTQADWAAEWGAQV